MNEMQVWDLYTEAYKKYHFETSEKRNAIYERGQLNAYTKILTGMGVASSTIRSVDSKITKAYMDVQELKEALKRAEKDFMKMKFAPRTRIVKYITNDFEEEIKNEISHS